MADPSSSQAPRLSARHSLAVRISALVVAVVLAAGASAILMLGQLRSLQASFELLTDVYVVFNQKLAAAHLQAMRIGQQVATFQEQGESAPEAPPRLDAAALGNFTLALDERARLIREARAPIDAALQDPDRFGGEQSVDDLRDLAGQLDQLESLVALDRVVDPVDVLRDDRTQAQIERRFQTLAERSRSAIDELQTEVARAQDRTETTTVALAALMGVFGFLAIGGVVLTLRPLRRLTARVRGLGRGEWDQRIALPRRDDEVAALGREFNLMAEALEERERRLLRGERLAAAGQLAAQITHEIRNPLSSVALNAELLEDEIGADQAEARRLLARISGEVDRLTAVTEDYLRFARRPKPELALVDLTAALGDLLEFLSDELTMSGIELVVDLPEQPVWVQADQNQLRQAFMNLLRNAQEAVAEASVSERSPRVEIRMWCKPDASSGVDSPAVMVSICDNGPGIEGGEERIFEAFHTSKARGTGLGLPIVQQILTDHGGAVAVARTGDDGTCFQVSLPACDPGAGPVTSQPADPSS